MTTATTSQAEPAARKVTSPWQPLRHKVFRGLWIASVASNVGTWLQSVGASWLMTSLTTSTMMVALVQAATSLPMFLMSLPAGAIADVVDRRRILLVTQSWMALAAASLSIVTLTGLTTPWLLLFFTFLLGMGAAVNGPAWQSIIPELVPREDLPGAVSLGSVGFNIARAAGPALGGLLVAAAGAGWTFALNAASFVGVITVLYRWERPEESSMLPAEHFLGAMRTGLRYVRHAPEVIAVIIKGSAFVLCGSALWALLPVVARTGLGRGPGAYGLLLTCLGVGAVSGAMGLPHLRGHLSADRIVSAATLVFALSTTALAWVRSFPLLCLAMLAAGSAWLALMSSLNVSIQTSVPSWVRARALSVYMLMFFGGLSGGSALWGAVAQEMGTPFALSAAAAGMAIGMVATWRVHLRSGEGLNLSPSRQWPAPIVSTDQETERPVLVTVDYTVDPERAREFTVAMRKVRRIRLRDGAMQWGLFFDSLQPDRYTEVFLVRSWTEHLRQHERVTMSDREILRVAQAFHVGPEPRVVRHLLGARVRDL